MSITYNTHESIFVKLNHFFCVVLFWYPLMKIGIRIGRLQSIGIYQIMGTYPYLHAHNQIMGTYPYLHTHNQIMGTYPYLHTHNNLVHLATTIQRRWPTKRPPFPLFLCLLLSFLTSLYSIFKITFFLALGMKAHNHIICGPATKIYPLSAGQPRLTSSNLVRLATTDHPSPHFYVSYPLFLALFLLSLYLTAFKL